MKQQLEGRMEVKLWSVRSRTSSEETVHRIARKANQNPVLTTKKDLQEGSRPEWCTCYVTVTIADESTDEKKSVPFANEHLHKHIFGEQTDKVQSKHFRHNMQNAIKKSK